MIGGNRNETAIVIPDNDAENTSTINLSDDTNQGQSDEVYIHF
jgi:hypothetical protein